ncbi:MAG: hypothetical protein ACXV2I_05520 [Actinomycetes bacterium]
MQRVAGVSAGFLLLAGATLTVAPGVASAASSDKPATHGSNGAEPPGLSKGDEASTTGGAHAAAAAPVSATAATGPDATTSTPSHGSVKQQATWSKHANGALDMPQPLSNADKNSGGANGQCPGGAYCSTRDGSPSGNGNGKGKSVGKPCAGCVGKADNKNPKGQRPNGSDHNNGYECDGNHGIGRTNPAHTGCKTPPPPPVCVPTPANHQCQTPPPPPPPACVPTPANHQCQTPPPPACVPTPANNQCQTPPPPACVPTPANNQCQSPPSPACVPAPGEDENCVQVEGTKTGTGTTGSPAVQARTVPAAAATGALPHTGAGALASLLCVGTFLLAGGGALLASGRRKRARA